MSAHISVNLVCYKASEVFTGDELEVLKDTDGIAFGGADHTLIRLGVIRCYFAESDYSLAGTEGMADSDLIDLES